MKQKIIGSLCLFVFALLCPRLSYQATLTYTYDNLNRLTKVVYGDGTTEEFTYDPAGNRLSLVIIVADTTGPTLSITSHTNNQHVNTSNITLAGTASDSGRGDSGIQRVTANGVRANNDTAPGNGTASWSKDLTLSPGANTIAVIASDNSSNHNQTSLNITIYYDALDTTGPSLAATSHSSNQHVSTSSITLSGTASDSERGDSGIQQVTVNGVRANNDTATGNGTANWSKDLTLSPGANAITVIAYDNSSNHNQTSQSITIYYDAAAETVSVPGTLSGPTSGSVGASYSYVTTGSTTSAGHGVEYQFDWEGDGTVLSAWGAQNRSNSWPTPGTYFPRVMARCSLHPSIVSFWSPALTVRILPPPPAVDQLPFGSLDAPLPNATVSGPIIAGGWALDDVGVTRVELRSDISFWPSLGDLYYTCGSRTDIAGLYPDYPNKDCAGWGIVWLTNFMSDYRDKTGKRILEGSTHQIFMRVYDTAGHFVDIGHRNVTIRNDGVEKPFGTINDPAPGLIVSGPVFVSGWALAKDGRRVTSVQIGLNEVPMWEATYEVNWPILTQFFPVSAYSYSENAAFVFTLDTTLFTNGRYQLGALVTDDAGNVEGIGSRFIYIQN